MKVCIILKFTPLAPYILVSECDSPTKDSTSLDSPISLWCREILESSHREQKDNLYLKGSCELTQYLWKTVCIIYQYFKCTFFGRQGCIL